MSLTLTSPAFEHGQMIPGKYTCDGEDISPALVWKQAPKGTQGFALVCDDPDAPVGVWDHWVIYNIPAHVAELAEAVPPDAELADGARQGVNSWKRVGYGGPCPPGGTHRYMFRLYALDTGLDLPPKASKEELESAMEGHILEQAELKGLYSR